MQPHSRRSQAHTTWNASTNWHSLSPERRPLKRQKGPSAGHLSHPDVYPQDPKQEEDKMSIDRLQKGYHVVTLPMEYESILKNPRLVCQDEISKNAKCLIQIIQKKNELNIINLDKKRNRECSFVGFLHPPAGVSQSSPGPFHRYFDEFAHGKALHQLTKRFPFFNKREECMDFLYMYKVPIQRAIWFFKTMQVGHSTPTTQNKQKKPAAVDQYGIDQTKMFTKYIREFFRLCDGSQQMESSPLYQRWPYFSCILKHSFEEGIVDRHDFLMDISDIANEYVKFSFEKPQIFRMLIIFLSQFVDVITQNAMLSRRIAYLIATRFKIYKTEYDQKRGSSLANVYASECFADLVNCQHHRAVVMTMLGILHAIIIDCPVALVWSSDPFESSDPLCGSPLDLLPCSSDVLTQHLPKSAAKIDELLQDRIAEIKRRSQHIENRWVLRPSSHSGFELIVEVCLNVISVLDKAILNAPNAFLKLYQSIFCAEANEKVSPDLLVRILIKWAVTTEREGTHRALMVCQLLRMRQRHYRSTAFGSRSLQSILVEYLSQESPTPFTSGANFHEEFSNLMHLFYELQRFHLFSHDAYVRALMRSGQFSYQEPILRRLLNLMEPDKSGAPMQKLSQAVSQGANNLQNNTSGQQHSQHLPQSSLDNLTSGKLDTSNSADPAIISFIPTSSNVGNSSLSVLSSVNSLSSTNFLGTTLSPISTSTESSVIPPALSMLPNLTSSLSSSSLLGGASGITDSSARSTPFTPNMSSIPPNATKEFASLLPKKSLEGHSFLINPTEMSIHERFFVHVPIEQTEERRDACNQRAILLYGISDEREVVRQELQKIAAQICRIWQKKVNVEFFENSKEVRFKRRFTADQIIECLAKFRIQTYYDQLVICGWCVRSFVEMICDFINCCSLLLPTAESLDIICSMLETCQNYHGILTLSVELLSQLTLLEKFLSSFNSDCIPGTISCQLAYVLAGYLAENFYYFLHSNEAPIILNGFYRLIEKELCAEGYPITGWARSIAAFIFHAKNELMNLNLCTTPLLGTVDVFRRIFPESGADKIPQELKYNPRLLTDFLQEPRRFYSFHDYKLHLPSIEDAHTQYSFVVNAFLVAKNSKHDFTKLAELSNICGHISAEKQLSGTWCVAIQELCYSSVSKNGYSHLISEINVDDLSTHYPLSTFVLLLASKYCFSCHALLTRLLNNVFMPFIKTDSSSFDGSEMGLCLALEIVSSLVCATDMPFILNGEYDAFSLGNNANGVTINNMTNGSAVNGVINNDPAENLSADNDGGNGIKKPLSKSADERALKIIQIRELDACIFPILSSICILTDAVKRKLNASNCTNYRLKRLLEVLKCSFLAMCEQEWVIKRIFRICESTDMESFNCSALKHNSLGQQLLRIALRRKSERTTKQQLMVCNGNSKKSLLDKLLSAMNLWNMRATYYDLKLMIKEISPDGIKHATQQAIAADALISEIGKCCRDLFLNCRRDDFYLLAQPHQPVSAFSFEKINCYWLISPLINVCPKPENIPQSFTGSSSVTVKAKFLKEAAAMLDTNHDNFRDRLRQSARLLSQQPFLNLILTCIQGEDLDNLINALLRHIQLIINKAKENPTLIHQSSFALEREGLLLRLNLIGGIFDSLLVNASTSEPWAIALFQLMFYEIISSDKDKEYFDVCYDMLFTLVHSMMAPSSPPADEKRPEKKLGDEKRPESRARFSAYNSFVKKIRKELGERNIPAELNCLAQLLPIPKSAAELNAWESFSSPQKNASTSKTLVGNNAYQYSGVRIDKQPHLVQRHLMRLLRHSHYTDVASPGIVGANVSSPDVFLSPPSMERVSTDLYITPCILPSPDSPVRATDSESSPMTATVTTSDTAGKPINGAAASAITDNMQFDQQNMQSIFSAVSSTSSITSSVAASMAAGPHPNQSLFNHPHQNSIFAETNDKIHQTGNTMGVLPGFDNSQQPSHNQAQHLSSQLQNRIGISGMPMGEITSTQNQQQNLLIGSRAGSLQQGVGNLMPKSEPLSQPGNSANASTGESIGLIGHGQHIGGSNPALPGQMPQQMSGDPVLQSRMFGTVGPSGLSGSRMGMGGPVGIVMDGSGSSSGLQHGLPGISVPSGGMSLMGNINQASVSGVHTVASHAAAAAAAGFLSDGTSRSGSSTPTTSGAIGESPRTNSGGAGRGGRRKNAATAGTIGTTAQGQTTSRGQKRKKDQKAQQPAHPQNPMMATGAPMMNAAGSVMGIGAMTGIGGHGPVGQTLGTVGMDLPGSAVQMSAGFQHIPHQQMSNNAAGVGSAQQSGSIPASHVLQQQQFWQHQMQQHGAPQNQHFYQQQAMQQQQIQRAKKQPQPMMPGSRFVGDHSGMMGGQTGGMPHGSMMSGSGGIQLPGGASGSVMFPSALTGQSTALANESKQNLQQKLLQKINNQHQQNPHHPI